MTAAELIERFSKAPPNHKLGGFLLLSALLGVVFYYLFYSDVSDRADGLSRQIVQQQQEKATYLEKQKQYNSFRQEVGKLLEERKELAKALPTNSEIPSFLQSIHAQGELAGLNILTFEQQVEVSKDFYAMIPVKMGLSGTFHQISKFFYSVGQLKRIVNIKDLKLDAPSTTDQGVILQATFMASTFRLIDNNPSGPPGQPPTPPPPPAPPG
jgi:type IV pilus assembly protein PilO